ncbi:hypothetical protein K502DRAFT_324340 [Neoconidiobolus thromboides FSU 785]|nr:hypothetical protein K502DRAFT_324340 [Neoconidiobolus thromboides FSU 785]
MDSEPTSCMSCSDKIAKWNTLGYQGSLLSDFVLPIFPITIVVGELFNPVSLKRALIDRIEGIKDDNYINYNVPKILHTSFNFKFGKYYLLNKNGDDIIIKPSEVALSWVENRTADLNNKANSERMVEILVNGRKQGAAINKKSGKYSLKTRSNLCKAIFFDKYLQNLKALQKVKFNENKEILVNSKNNETGYYITKANYESERKKSYAEIKRDIENKQGLKSIYEKRRTKFFKCSPFDEWKFTGENQMEYNKFMIEE